MMDEPIKLTKSKPEYFGKEKIAVYLSSNSMRRVKDSAEVQGVSISKYIVGLMNDGIRWRTK